MPITITIEVELPVLPRFTPRENSVLSCLGRGLTTKEIATALRLTDATARTYVVSMIAKTHYNRHELGIIGFILQSKAGMNDQPHPAWVASTQVDRGAENAVSRVASSGGR
jgi:hypothetical protein